MPGRGAASVRMAAWRAVALGAVAVAPFAPSGDAPHQIPLKIGDHVQIREGREREREKEREEGT